MTTECLSIRQKPKCSCRFPQDQIGNASGFVVCRGSHSVLLTDKEADRSHAEGRGGHVAARTESHVREVTVETPCCSRRTSSDFGGKIRIEV